jgi:ACS family hexuronate transporter-like MFS transporter
MTQDAQPAGAGRSAAWERGLAAVLLSATLVNYATRQALPAAAVRVQADLEISNQEYGQVQGVFGLAFAFGGLAFGVLADWWSVRWLYPAVVLVWSTAGVAAGFSESLAALWWTHLAMGAFQAGHWACALRTTQRVFPPARRTLANSLLQAGAPLGAVAVSVLMLVVVGARPDGWRPMFWLVGGVGAPWALAWLALVRSADLRRPALQTADESDLAGAERGASGAFEELPLAAVLLSRRFVLLLLTVLCINTCWHYLRAWLPMILEKDLHYSSEAVQGVMIGYWLATLAGGIGGGWLVTRLTVRAWPVHRARLTVFLGLALITALMAVAALLPAGPVVIGLLLLVGFGSLGQFPIFYSLTQELSARHQGKVGGTLGFVAWLPLYFLHPLVGRLMDTHPEARPYLFAVVGVLPLTAWAALAIGWGRRPRSAAQAA